MFAVARSTPSAASTGPSSAAAGRLSTISRLHPARSAAAAAPRRRRARRRANADRRGTRAEPRDHADRCRASARAPRWCHRPDRDAGRRAAAGARLAAPLARSGAIMTGSRRWRFLRDQAVLARDLRARWPSVPDIDRALSRLALDRGGPRDLAAIRAAMAQAGRSAVAARRPGDHAGCAGCPEAAPALALRHDWRRSPRARARRSTTTLPLLARDGGFVATGYDAGHSTTSARLRDETRRRDRRAAGPAMPSETAIAVAQDPAQRRARLFRRSARPTGQEAARRAAHEIFIHRQTMANVMRFTTGELAELEGRIAGPMTSARDRDGYSPAWSRMLGRTDALAIADGARRTRRRARAGPSGVASRLYPARGR